MRITFADRLSRGRVTEGSAFDVVAKFYDDSTEDWTASTPTTVKYRIDTCDGYQVRDWTSVAASSSVTISVTYTDNAMQGSDDIEARALTVRANEGLSGQYQAVYSYSVVDLEGQP
jgi:hypothetical protein